MSDEKSGENELSTEVLQLAQEWRDRAFGSAHMSKLKSDTLGECAAELDALLGPPEVTEAMHAAMTRALQQAELEAPREPSEGVRLMVEQAVLDYVPLEPAEERVFRAGVERGLALAATALSLAREQTERNAQDWSEQRGRAQRAEARITEMLRGKPDVVQVESFERKVMSVCALLKDVTGLRAPAVELPPPGQFSDEPKHLRALLLRALFLYEAGSVEQALRLFGYVQGVMARELRKVGVPVEWLSYEAENRSDRLEARGFEPVTESTPGHFVGDALGLPRAPDAVEDTERLYDSAYSPGHDELRDVFQLCKQADAEVTKGSHGYIQWKGTQVCMDVYCSCGEHTHVDASFAYTIECGACGKLWAVCSNVRLVEITRAELHNRCTPVLSEVFSE